MLSAKGGSQLVSVGLAFVATVILLIVIMFAFSYGMLYVKALLAGSPVGIFEIIAMKLRGVRPAAIVDTRIFAAKAGLPVQTHELETHYLAGGNVPDVIRALVAADIGGIPLTFEEACALDLAGVDVLDAVVTCVNPKVCECPDARDGGPEYVRAAARDGVEVEAKARVTLRADLDRLLTGAKEPEIIARVANAIEDVIEESETYRNVRRNRAAIADELMAMGLDDGTACRIVSIELEARRART